MSNASIGTDGTITGPTSGTSTDNAVVRWDGTDGQVIQDSNVIIDDSDNVTGVASLTLASGATPTEFSTDGTLAGDSDTAIPTEKAVKTYVDGKNYPFIAHFDAKDLDSLETNFGALEKLTGTNVKVMVRAYDKDTEEYNNKKLHIPADIDPNGTVTFRAYVSAKTAAASKNIGLTFGHLPLNDSEDWDPSNPYTDVDTGAVAINATQDKLTLVTWTETVSNLGWVANDVVPFRLSRDISVANNLQADMYLWDFNVSATRT